MGGIEELPDESGPCPVCSKVATTKCTGCKKAGIEQVRSKVSRASPSLAGLLL